MFCLSPQNDDDYGKYYCRRSLQGRATVRVERARDSLDSSCAKSFIVRRPHINRSGATTLSHMTTASKATCLPDLWEACWLALQPLMGGADSQAYKLVNVWGFSVQVVIDTAQRVTGRKVAVINEPRSACDPSRLMADASFVRQQLGRKPKFADLDTIVVHAWAWESCVR